MLEKKYRWLKARSELVFNTGNTESDFRARIVVGLALLLGVCNCVLIVDDLNAGHYVIAALLSLVPISAASSLWLLFEKYRLDTAASLLIGTLFFVLALGLFLTGGGTVGAYVAMPAIILLASFVCQRKIAVAITGATLVVICAVAWLSTTDYVPLLAVETSVMWMLTRVTAVISVLTMISMFVYRDAAELVRKKAMLVQQQLKSTNSELSSVLSAQMASAKLLLKVQEIGDLIGWWYESASGTVHYTTTENAEFRSFNLRTPDVNEDNESRLLLGDNLRDIILARIESTSPWDDETRIANGSGGLNWYRDSGEVETLNGDISRIVGVLQDITATKTLTDKLELRANYDELTGLCNRRMFWKAVAHEHASFSKESSGSHLLFIDLDQFKLVNDTSGHVAGDRLLKIVAAALRKNVHSSDVVGRVGGDEFGVVVRECTDTTVGKIAERLRRVVEQIHFHWEGETFRVGASIGVISINPAHGTAQELQQLVDVACYEAKLAGRNRVNFFEGGEEIIAAHRGEARWVQRLHDAMEHDRFELHGQLIKPVANDDEPERYEVLLRLIDAEDGRIIPPGAFLPAAERFGLSPQIDQWVLEHLLKRLHADPDHSTLNRRYWVNLSGISIGDAMFADYLIETMRNSSLPKGMVNFEITETAVIRNIAGAGALIEELREMGCQFALDDFGSGLSSFGYLKKLSVDSLKIDGMFVREILNDEVDRVFVRAIINIAQAIGIKTVAEFVENDEIYELVKGFGVDYVQGYGIHRPEKLTFRDLSTEQSIEMNNRKAG